MPIEIRTFRPGDEEKQISIYNSVAGSLPGFKTAGVGEVTRRTQAKDFDPSTRFYAVDSGEVVGYSTMQPNGRIGYPWCRAGCNAELPLLNAALDSCRIRGIKRVYSAYRTDWAAQAAFFEKNGFRKVRCDIVNFSQNLLDLPTMVIRRGLNVTPLKKEDIPGIAALGAGVVRVGPDRLESFLFANPYFPSSAMFALRRSDDSVQGVGLLIANSAYANPLQIDSAAPCFRLGAFGTEETSTKRYVNGLFSFLVRDDSDSLPLGLDLLSYALTLIQDDESVEVLAAQVPSDAKHLLNFYQKYFRKQGSFPVFGAGARFSHADAFLTRQDLLWGWLLERGRVQGRGTLERWRYGRAQDLLSGLRRLSAGAFSPRHDQESPVPLGAGRKPQRSRNLPASTRGARPAAGPLRGSGRATKNLKTLINSRVLVGEKKRTATQTEY